MAARGPFAIDERPDVAYELPSGDLAADHPEQRASVANLVSAFRDHAGGMDVLGWVVSCAAFCLPFGDAPPEISDRLDPDAQFQEV